MTIARWWEFVHKVYHSVPVCSWKDLKGYVLGIDAPGLVYHFWMTCNGSRVEVEAQLLQLVCQWQALSIKCVFVFDGARLPEKRDEHQRRQVARDKVKGRLQLKRKACEEARQEAGRSLSEVQLLEADILKLEVQSHDVGSELHYFATRLRAADCVVVTAPFQADQVLRQLSQLGVIDAVCSEDGDLMVSPGVTLLLRNYWWPEGVRVYRPPLFACKLGLSPHLMLLLAVLCGCDLVPPAQRGMGPARWFQRLREAMKEEADACAACMNVVRPVMEQRGLDYAGKLVAAWRIMSGFERAHVLPRGQVVKLRASLNAVTCHVSNANGTPSGGGNPLSSLQGSVCAPTQPPDRGASESRLLSVAPGTQDTQASAGS
jgi:5'-3' exonuclease